MRERSFLRYLWIALILKVGVVALADLQPTITPGTDLSLLSQSATSFDLRPRLSISQQAQILSDVQQHQQHFPTTEQLTTPYSSLAKYKVDRAKQQQQHVQQRLHERQQKPPQQLREDHIKRGSGQATYQAHSLPTKSQQYQSVPSQQYNGQYHKLSNNYQTIQQDFRPPFFNDQQTIHLQAYLQKQRELELLEKQRQHLLLEQQELRRQQEILKLEQLQRATSTTTTIRSPLLSSSLSTPNSVTVITTPEPILLSSPTARRVTASEAQLFLKAIANHQQKYSSTTPSVLEMTKIMHGTIQGNTSSSENLVRLVQDSRIGTLQTVWNKPKSALKVSYEAEQSNSKVDDSSTPNLKARSNLSTTSSSILSGREQLLKDLKMALAQSVDDHGSHRNVTTRDLILPNGKKLQVIHAPNGLPSLVSIDSEKNSSLLKHLSSPVTTVKPPKAIFEELTKGGVLPPDADFEVIRQKSDGKLEDIGKVPIQNLPAKKVTFVILEEQPDGSYKVQGVKGNTDKENEGDVETLVKKIKNGEIKLPPSSLHSKSITSSISDTEQSLKQHLLPRLTTSKPAAGRSIFPYTGSKSTSGYASSVTPSLSYISSTDKYVTSASSIADHIYDITSNRQPSSTTTYSNEARSQFIPTMSPINGSVSTTTSYVSTTLSRPTSYTHFNARPPLNSLSVTRSVSTTSKTLIPSSNIQHDNIVYQDTVGTTMLPPAKLVPTKSQISSDSLIMLLRREGLFAMAKYLHQSGLDNILNETGPYTLFVPTDKAFRTLLVQLGGPEKAEHKFEENPRLLSGLLLHHVIPGAFRIDSLQDEMTGVSLAGTQLRVNEYGMHDHEWNDVKVTTINGARIIPNKQDIEIPQGVAHAIDRVMFPLPVGDLLQTLQADRERRFTTFLHMLHISGLEDTLTGPKTFTVFAPTDSAFAGTLTKNGAPIWSEADGPEAAKTIISKHIVPTSLYTAGMRYYLQKDTLHPQAPIHIHKSGGRIRVNEAYVITHNVPATNGVLHAIDGVI